MRKALVPLAVLLALSNVPAIDFTGWRSITGTGRAATWFAVNPSFTEIWLEGWPLSVATGLKVPDVTYVPSNGMAWDKGGNRWFAGTADSGLVCYRTDGAKNVYLKSAGLASNGTLTVKYDSTVNRIVVGMDIGVCVVALDADFRPTTWTNALNVAIREIVVAPNGCIWALNVWGRVYRFANGSWTEYTQFPSPISGALDTAGNFVLSFERLINVVHYQEGLARFNGSAWTEFLVHDSTNNADYFGTIAIDKHNMLWFSGNGIGTVNLSTSAEERVALGTFAWAPAVAAASVNLITHPEGEVMFSGSNEILWKPGVNSVRSPLVVVTGGSLCERNEGAFDLLGRSIISRDLSSARSSGSYFTAGGTEDRARVSKILTIR